MENRKIDKEKIVTRLEEMALLLELKGENPFKIRAFENGARLLDGTDADLYKLAQEKKLTTLKGIGDHLAKIIEELLTTGQCQEYLSLKKEFPESLFEILNLQGVGPKKVKIFYEKLKIKTIDDLESACHHHKISTLPGFSQKTEENILKSIASAKKRQGRFLYPLVYEEAEKLKAYLSNLTEIDELEMAGSLRRFKETVKDIDLVAASNDADVIMKKFTAYPDVQRVLAEGETKSSITLKSGINVDLRVVCKEEFPFALVYFTGSKEHNTHLRQIAKDKGFKLNEYGLFKGKKSLPAKDEAGVYKALGMNYLEPELREDSGEIEAALEHTLPKDLVRHQDLKGTFHNHTTYSDGRHSLEQMVQSAQDLGFDYIGISDHSPYAAYANGLKPDRLKVQQGEIDRLQKKFKIRILKGTECDILADGSLDYADDILKSFDFVIASVHSKFNMEEKEMTARITKALKHKYVTMIGHPTGRLLSKREGYPVNLHALVDVASDYGKVMELNAHPQRFDISWQLCKYAKSKKVLVSINPDAHHREGLEVLQYGVELARKGWLEKKDVFNTRTLAEVEKILQTCRK